MEEKIAFEQFLFGDEKEIIIDDMEFCVDRIVMLPKIRPHQLEKAVRLSIQYCQKAEFRRKLLKKSLECPTLIYQLFKKGVLLFNEVKPFLNDRMLSFLDIIFGNIYHILRVFIQLGPNLIVNHSSKI